MAISEDTSNQPVAVHSTTRTGTTASFSPQANTLLVALVAVDGAANLATTAAITDSLSGTWTLLKRQNTIVSGSLGGSSEVWCRYLSSAPGSMTVTSTWSVNGQPGGNLVVRSLLGADPTQPGATGGAGGASIAPTAALTPTVIGAWVYGAILDYTTNTTLTANANTSIVDQYVDATNGDTWGTIKGSAAVSSLSSTTYGCTNANADYNVALAEILPLAGGGAVVQPEPVVLDQALCRSSLW